jgi:hypothetical protein
MFLSSWFLPNEAILPLWFSVPSVAKKQNEPNFRIFQQISWVIKTGIPAYLYTCIPVLPKRTQFSSFLSEFCGLIIFQFSIVHCQFRRFGGAGRNLDFTDRLAYTSASRFGQER